jgi:NTE family protein
MLLLLELPTLFPCQKPTDNSQQPSSLYTKNIIFIHSSTRQQSMSEKKYKTGLVLSGGGTRGFAHLGAIKALQEEGINPDIIVGVSAGSIVGAFIADGHKPDDVLHILAKHKLFHYLEFTIPKTGLVKMSRLEKVFTSELKAKHFEELSIPLLVFAVNMNTAEYTRFDKGELASAITASSSIPIIFPPVKIGKHYFLDGGMINNFPVEVLKDDCETIIGINVNPIGEVEELGNLRDIAERTFHITLRNQAASKEEMCNIYIEPSELYQYGLLDVSKAVEIFELGYAAAKKALKKYKK